MGEVEFLMATRFRCLHCGRTWELVKETLSFFDQACCGTVRVEQYPHQATFSDEGGSWLRRRAVVAIREAVRGG